MYSQGFKRTICLKYFEKIGLQDILQTHAAVKSVYDVRVSVTQ